MPFCRDATVVLVNVERLWGKARTATLEPRGLAGVSWNFCMRELKESAPLASRKGHFRNEG